MVMDVSVAAASAGCAGQSRAISPPRPPHCSEVSAAEGRFRRNAFSWADRGWRIGVMRGGERVRDVPRCDLGGGSVLRGGRAVKCPPAPPEDHSDGLDGEEPSVERTDRAKLFWSGRSQALRLPKEYRFDDLTSRVSLCLPHLLVKHPSASPDTIDIFQRYIPPGGECGTSRSGKAVLVGAIAGSASSEGIPLRRHRGADTPAR